MSKRKTLSIVLFILSNFLIIFSIFISKSGLTNLFIEQIMYYFTLPDYAFSKPLRTKIFKNAYQLCIWFFTINFIFVFIYQKIKNKNTIKFTNIFTFLLFIFSIYYFDNSQSISSIKYLETRSDILTKESFILEEKTTPYFNTKIDKGILIAHAGGAIDNFTYTNSNEALIQAKEKNYNYIELDMIITEDKRILAGHDWEHFAKISGTHSHTLSEILEYKIHNKYTILYDETIFDYFENNTQITLVTDKIKDFDLINKYLPFQAKEQLIVEVFSLDDYKLALSKDIKYPALCIWNAKSLIYHYNLLCRGGVSMITCPVSLIDTHAVLLQKLHNRGVNIFAFTSNDIPFINHHLGTTVTGFYTDTITPRELVNAKK